MYPKKSIIKFWEKINVKNECWIWAGNQDKYGYGRIGINYKRYYAHRLAYELIYGLIPEGMLVCHKCDNPLCINPEHLFLGTNGDNSKDMVNKNRSYHPIGELHPLHKLTNEQVIEIKQLYSTGKYLQTELAKQFNVCSTEICLLVNNKRWNKL